MALPRINTDDRVLSMLQDKWISELNPVLANPSTNPLLLKDIKLVVGDNVINHKLAKTLQGWIVTDIDAATVLFRSAPKNDKTLTLNSSAIATLSLLVY